jgi:MarR family transcriptional regulator, organic hydroperoxide resistance regulator
MAAVGPDLEIAGLEQQCAVARELLQTSDLNWLLHRAAQRLGEAVNNAARHHGIDMRAQLVLTALMQEPGRTQLALAAALALDKTTLTAMLDKLERSGLVVRKPDPADRRVRIPEITEAGRAVQTQVAPAVRQVEVDVLRSLSPQQRDDLRDILRELVHTPAEHDSLPGGSCL